MVRLLTLYAFSVQQVVPAQGDGAFYLGLLKYENTRLLECCREAPANTSGDALEDAEDCVCDLAFGLVVNGLNS